MVNKLRWKQRFSNFQKALAVFERRVNEYRMHRTDEGAQLALVQAYEFTFELSWKTMKDYIELQGYDGIAGPKEIIRQTFQYKVISNGGLWLEALDIRNQTTHVYDDLILKKVLKFSDETFPELLHEFNERFKNI